MKKYFGLIVALFCIIGLSATSAMAAIKINDQLSLKGQMRFRHWDKENRTFDSSSTSGQQDYWDQRFRLQVNFVPQKDISAHLRFDFNDADWGAETFGSSRWNRSTDPAEGKTANHDDTIEVGRAYLQIAQPEFKIVGGLSYWKLGEKLSYENTGTGMTVESTSLPVNVRIGYTLEDEGGSRSDTGVNGDQSNFFIEATRKQSGHLLKAFYAMAKDDETKNEPWVIGVSGRGKTGIFKYFGELDYLGGEYENNFDFKGLQLWLNGTAQLSKKLKLGADLLYAKGSDDPTTERQISAIQDARSDDWGFQVRGPFYMMNLPIGGGDEMDPEDQSTGSVGGGIYAEYQLLEKLKTYAQVVYLAAETNSAPSQTFENVIIANVAARYNFTKNSEFSVGYSHTAMEHKGSLKDDPAKTLSFMIRVKF